MFLKLLKTDFKYYSRNFLPILFSVLISNLFVLFLSSKKFDTLGTIPEFVNSVALIIMGAAGVWTLLTFIKIFNQKFISTESYLTFSMPVRRYQHLLSNIFTSVFWGLIIGALFFCSAVFLCSQNDVNLIYQILNTWSKLSIVYVVTSCFAFFLSLLSNLILIYFCILAVNTSKLKNRPKLFGMILFLLSNYVSFKILLNFDEFFVSHFNIDCLIDYPVISNVVSIVTIGILVILYYCGCIYILNKKLEVD